MAEYSSEEYIDMVIMYGEAGRNAALAARFYAEEFPDRERHPCPQVILRCVQRCRETGSVLLSRRDRGERMQVRVDDEERILRAFEENPGKSVRRIARALGLSRYVVHRTLRRNGLHPYHYQRVQQIFARDAEQRIYFCEGIFIIFIKCLCYFKQY